MFGKKKRAPQPRGQGAAAAKQVTTTPTTPTNANENMVNVAFSLDTSRPWVELMFHFRVSDGSVCRPGP